MKGDTEPPQTFTETLLVSLAVVVLCIPVIVTVWCITSLGMSTGLSLWASLAISIVITALLMAWSISRQGNSLMEVMIAMFVIMVLILVLMPVFHKAREKGLKNREKNELQLKRQRTPTSPILNKPELSG